ncbi:MAG: ABC transporter ATP-binding protein [Burkholderiaceae bacterium]
MNASTAPAARARTARSDGGEPLLDVERLSVGYGKALVIREFSLQVYPNEFVVLLGRNGAGKSTILHALSGLIPKRGGRVRYDGRDITQAPARDIVRGGMIQVLERHRVFTQLSVEDNLLIGTYARHRRGDRGKLERIYELFPELADKRGQAASRLSGGQQEILAVAQGVIGEPRLLILDEPSGGLAPIVIDRILDIADRLCREGGMSILLVEQMVEKALRHAHHCYLLANGTALGDGPPAAIHGSDLLRACYLGHAGETSTTESAT